MSDWLELSRLIGFSLPSSQPMGSLPRPETTWTPTATVPLGDELETTSTTHTTDSRMFPNIGGRGPKSSTCHYDTRSMTIRCVVNEVHFPHSVQELETKRTSEAKRTFETSIPHQPMWSSPPSGAQTSSVAKIGTRMEPWRCSIYYHTQFLIRLA